MQPHDTEPRLINLEIKASLADDLLDTLNQTVFRQQQQIESLMRQVAALSLQLNEASSQATNAFNSSPNELPPHY